MIHSSWIIYQNDLVSNVPYICGLSVTWPLKVKRLLFRVSPCHNWFTFLLFFLIHQTTFLKVLNSALFNFLWGGKNNEKSRTILKQTYEQRSLNVVNIFDFLKGMKIAWIKRYIGQSSGAWKVLFNYFLREVGKTSCPIEIFEGKICQLRLSMSFLIIAVAQRAIWHLIPVENYCDQVVWNNTFIKVKGEIICFNLNFKFVRDFYHSTGKSLHYKDFILRYNYPTFPYTF